jgi:hypothetical protein
MQKQLDDLSMGNKGKGQNSVGLFKKRHLEKQCPFLMYVP